MTYAELAALVASVLPNAQLGEDFDGQLVIYTNYRLLEDDTVVDMGDNAEN